MTKYVLLALAVFAVVSWLLWHNIGYAIRRRREADEHETNSI